MLPEVYFCIYSFFARLDDDEVGPRLLFERKEHHYAKKVNVLNI